MKTESKAPAIESEKKSLKPRKKLKLLQDGEILAVNGGGVVVEGQY